MTESEKNLILFNHMLKLTEDEIEVYENLSYNTSDHDLFSKESFNESNKHIMLTLVNCIAYNNKELIPIFFFVLSPLNEIFRIARYTYVNEDIPYSVKYTKLKCMLYLLLESRIKNTISQDHKLTNAEENLIINFSIKYSSTYFNILMYDQDFNELQDSLNKINVNKFGLIPTFKSFEDGLTNIQDVGKFILSSIESIKIVNSMTTELLKYVKQHGLILQFKELYKFEHLFEEMPNHRLWISCSLFKLLESTFMTPSRKLCSFATRSITVFHSDSCPNQKQKIKKEEPIEGNPTFLSCGLNHKNDYNFNSPNYDNYGCFETTTYRTSDILIKQDFDSNFRIPFNCFKPYHSIDNNYSIDTDKYVHFKIHNKCQLTIDTTYSKCPNKKHIPDLSNLPEEQVDYWYGYHMFLTNLQLTELISVPTQYQNAFNDNYEQLCAYLRTWEHL